KRQVAIAFRKVQAITDHKIIGYVEADVVRLDIFDTPRRFVQQDTGLNTARLEHAQLAEDAIQGFAGVQNVVHQQDIAAADIQAQFFRKDKFAGFSACAV